MAATNIEVVAEAGKRIGLDSIRARRWAKFISIVYPEEFQNILRNPVYAASSEIKTWANNYRANREYVAASSSMPALAALFLADGENQAKGYMRKQLRPRMSLDAINFYINQVLDFLGHQEAGELELLKATPIEGVETFEEITWVIPDSPFSYSAFKGDGSAKHNNWGVYQASKSGVNIMSFGITRQNAEIEAKRLANEDALRLGTVAKGVKSITIQGSYPIKPGQLKTDKREYIKMSMVPSEAHGKYIVRFVSLTKGTKQTREITKRDAEMIIYKLKNLTDIIKTFNEYM